MRFTIMSGVSSQPPPVMMNESLLGLERHEGEQLITEFSFEFSFVHFICLSKKFCNQQQSLHGKL